MYVFFCDSKDYTFIQNMQIKLSHIYIYRTAISFKGLFTCDQRSFIIMNNRAAYVICIVYHTIWRIFYRSILRNLHLLTKLRKNNKVKKSEFWYNINMYNIYIYIKVPGAPLRIIIHKYGVKLRIYAGGGSTGSSPHQTSSSVLQ